MCQRLYHLKLCLCSLIFLIGSSIVGYSQQNEAYRLPNGWGLSPAGKTISLGDLPLNIAVSPDGHYMAVTNNGVSTPLLQIIDLEKQVQVDSAELHGAWLGLCFGPKGKDIYLSGGNSNYILHFPFSQGNLKTPDTFRLGQEWPAKISPAGICINKAGNCLFVVTKDNNALYRIDLHKRKISGPFELGSEGYTCLLSKKEDVLFIAAWGSGKILLFSPRSNSMIGNIAVGSHPNELCLSPDGNYLYVANAMDNSVSVIDTKARKVIETLDAAIYPNSPVGSTTNGLALSKNGRTLYVANADNNCLAVFDISQPGMSKSLGFIPTGWYPSCVRTHGNTLYVANGKGLSSSPITFGPNPTKRDESVKSHQYDATHVKKRQYIGSLFKGALSIIPEPDQKTISIFTEQVYRNTPYKEKQLLEAEGKPGNPVPIKVGAPSPIKYVFYIIKENRTFDQILSDVPGANGDTSLLLFGKKITPNLHAFAENFVLLDNFYTDGEVSADGHNWSMGAYANDYLEKTWPGSYGGRGGGYDAEGFRTIANNKLFFWDLCKNAGISYRSYGEFISDKKANISVLEGHFCKDYTGWDPDLPDTARYNVWKRDFDSLLKTNAIPEFNTLRFSNDHTQGLKKGKPTPFAQVADNDLACGLFLDHLSHSPVWKESVVFILEDDAQNGPDHVDAHRSTAYLAGPYVKRGYIDHTPYSTSSFVRTMELILGLPPMSQYDAAAMPLYRCFTDVPNTLGYQVISSNIDLTSKNIVWNRGARMSEGIDLSAEDRVPDAILNEILWLAVKGPSSECPAPRRAAFLKIHPEVDKD